MKRCGWRRRRSRRFAGRCRNASQGVASRCKAAGPYRSNPQAHPPMPKPIASLSLDLDNKWSYLKTHGDGGWESYPSYLDRVVPRFLGLLDDVGLRVTVFVVGQDAARQSNYDSLAAISAAGHGIGNHSFHHEPWLHDYSA